MSIPYNANLSWDVYHSNPNWFIEQLDPTTESCYASEVLAETCKEPFKRGIQFTRDTARLVLKVPIRAIRTPFFLSDNWKQYKRAQINAKLTGYSFVHLLSVPAKFLVALTALAASGVSLQKAQWLLENIEFFTNTLDGRASQLEALKEEGTINAQTPEEFDAYERWLYSIDPKLCRQNYR